jgi:hypothetical protein
MVWYTPIAWYTVEIMPTGFWTVTGFLWEAPAQ